MYRIALQQKKIGWLIAKFGKKNKMEKLQILVTNYGRHSFDNDKFFLTLSFYFGKNLLKYPIGVLK